LRSRSSDLDVAGCGKWLISGQWVVIELHMYQENGRYSSAFTRWIPSVAAPCETNETALSGAGWIPDEWLIQFLYCLFLILDFVSPKVFLSLDSIVQLCRFTWTLKGCFFVISFVVFLSSSPPSALDDWFACCTYGFFCLHKWHQWAYVIFVIIFIEYNTVCFWLLCRCFGFWWYFLDFIHFILHIDTNRVKWSVRNKRFPYY